MASENTPIEQFFAEKAAASGNSVAEATRFRTAPKGSYTLQVTGAEGKTWSNNTNTRNGAHLSVSILKGGRKIATAFTDVSWEEVRTQKGGLDGKYKLWVQWTKALFADKKADELAALTVQEVIGAMKSYPVSGYVAEQYVVPATDEDKANGYTYPTKKQTARTEEEEKQYREMGAKPVNTILNVYPYKEESVG